MCFWVFPPCPFVFSPPFFVPKQDLNKQLAQQRAEFEEKLKNKDMAIGALRKAALSFGHR